MAGCAGALSLNSPMRCASVHLLSFGLAPFWYLPLSILVILTRSPQTRIAAVLSLTIMVGSSKAVARAKRGINFVVVDCDTVLLKKHAFFDADTSLLRLAYEHSPHYKMFERSIGVSAASFLSFTCHMMPYQGNVLKNLLKNIEAKHGVHWARYFAEYAIDHGMVVNEQDLYARYLISTGSPIRYVPWLNKTVPFSANENIQDLEKRYSNRNCVSLHNNEDRKLIIK